MPVSSKNTKPNAYHVSDSHFRILGEAQEAVIKLRTLKPFLTPRDEETLALLMDKELMAHLAKSLREAEKNKVEPLENILR